MRKALFVFVVLALFVSAAHAADFSPTLMELTANPVIQYDFDGSKLEIPIKVSGTSAGLIFCVYTKDKAAEIEPTENGFMGWHYVNKVDTCIYYSSLMGFGIGDNTVTWDGKDQDGNKVPPGDYTYYMWAYDNLGTKEKMMDFWRPYARGSAVIQELDESGLPLDNPIYYVMNRRWIVGNDPMDETLITTCTVKAASGWSLRGDPCIDPTDFNYFYAQCGNADASTGGIQKYKWVPGGDAELQTDFGNEGYSDLFTSNDKGARWGPGVVTDGTYLYTTDAGILLTDPETKFAIYDYEGLLVSLVDLTEWWSQPEALEAGAQMNGGPNQFDLRNDYIFLNSHTSCTKQMVDPIKYLETDEPEDFCVWINGNGDYILDHNFEETAGLRWICNDYNVGPYTYYMAADNNLFSVVNAYDVGAVSFGMMGPDGTGIGYFAYAGETAGWKKGTFYIDSGCRYDGLYCDNEQTGGSHYDFDKEKKGSGTYFIAHDSITGVITNAVGVAEETPAAFSVEQNAPNPFNPTTTITFSLAQAGDVTVEVYNVAGQRIDTLVDGFMDAGSHSAVWDASGFSAGVYFYTVKSGGYTKTMKMTLLK